MRQLTSNGHEAMPWPNQLPERVVRYLLAPHEGLVLDLFSGTCTTAEAASNMGLRSISVDMSSQALGVGRAPRPHNADGPGQSGGWRMKEDS